MRAFTEGPWTRPPKIILGIDIGTTQSAVAFAYLYPNGPQSLYRVAAWPGQETHRGESKIPTLVYYDKSGKVRQPSIGMRLCLTTISRPCLSALKH
ncbi:hypothetical protein FRC12_022591 [Ceratobasidium sp. 428]|nr:hypothetical protein FRC12_022591 [Ceratobasidium sp. 428]